MGGRWPNIECWLGSFVIFQRIQTIILLRNPIFLWFFRGGGWSGPPVLPSGSTHGHHGKGILQHAFVTWNINRVICQNIIWNIKPWFFYLVGSKFWKCPNALLWEDKKDMTHLFKKKNQKKSWINSYIWTGNPSWRVFILDESRIFSNGNEKKHGARKGRSRLRSVGIVTMHAWMIFYEKVHFKCKKFSEKNSQTMKKAWISRKACNHAQHAYLHAVHCCMLFPLIN